MSWYTTGTVSLTNGSKTVTGVGTKWTNSLIGVCAGQMLILKTANTIEICEIASVQSDTQLMLANQYSGVSKKGVSYEIPTAPNVSIEALALRISEMLNYYQQQMNGWQSILTGSGDITLTAPDGRVVTIKSQKALIEAINNTVKKSGDTMTGNLTINNSDSSAVLLRNKKNEEWMLRIHADGSFSIVNKKDGKWVSKFRNEATTNTWRFENTDDVTIAGKSVLKAGDYGVGAPTGTSIQNLDEHLNGGFYGTNTAKIPNLPFAGGGSAASLLVLPSESPHWKVEQLSVVNGRVPKIYYRTDTKNDGKQEWYEAITTVNVGEYTHPFKGDLANKSLNDLTGTDAGIYFQGRNTSATAENSYPIAQAGTLNVMKNGADGEGCCQIYTTYRSARQFIRNYRGGTKTWEQWVEQITTANINQFVPVGDHRLMPFRANELPFGWYFRNGDNYLLSSPQGQALNGLSANYKRDHRITIKTIAGKQYINVPNAFHSDGRGLFERPVNGTARQVGHIELDAIRNIHGTLPNGAGKALLGHENITNGDINGAIGVQYSGYDNLGMGAPNRQTKWMFFDFDASRVVPTANENRPINIGLTPTIYLGV